MLRRTSLHRWDFPLAYRRSEPTHDQSGPFPFSTHTVCRPIIRRSTPTFAPGPSPSSSQRAAGKVAWRLAVIVTTCMVFSLSRIALLSNVSGKAHSCRVKRGLVESRDQARGPTTAEGLRMPALA